MFVIIQNWAKLDLKTPLHHNLSKLCFVCTVLILNNRKSTCTLWVFGVCINNTVAHRNWHITHLQKFPGSLDVSPWLCLSSFPRVETRFNTHCQNAYNMQMPSETPFSNCCVYHRTLSRVRVLVTAQLHCTVWPVEQRSCRAHAFT